MQELTREEQTNRKSGILIKLATAIGLAATAAFIIFGISEEIFTSKQAMETFLDPFGIWAPFIFVLIQIIQVVIPIIPGGVSCLMGVLLFGSVTGFLCNFIGIAIGSVFAFLLAKRFGQAFVKSITSEKTYKKYSGWLDRGKKFNICFALAIFLPGAPDDILCFLAGMTKMGLKKFTLIILLAKPVTIAFYSISMSVVSDMFL